MILPMEIKDVAVWVCNGNGVAVAKNPIYLDDLPTRNQKDAFRAAEDWRHSQVNQPACDQSLTGEYPASEVEVRYQYKLKSEKEWTTDLNADTYKNSYDYFEYNTKMISNEFETRLYLTLKGKQETKEPEMKFGEWISVKDKLPGKRGQYLCLSMNGEYMIRECYAGYSEKLEFAHHFNITHWMPLPAPLKTI